MPSQPSQPPQPSFTPSTLGGGLVYLSAVRPPETAGGRIEGDIRQQARAVLEEANRRLAEHRVSLHDAAAVSVYLRRAEDFAAMNEVYRTFVGDAPATRTTVVANPVHPDALIEIAVIVAAPGTSRRAMHPSTWVKSPNPYSYIVEAGDTVFLSGLIARNGADNSFVPGDMASQSKTVLENARTLLATAGLGFEHVVSARVFITDLAQFDAMNRVYREYFPKEPPARATVGAALMGPGYLVEMTFVASRTRKEVFNPDGQANPNLSAAVRAGWRLYLSGMLGLDAEPKGDPAAQTRRTLEKMGAIMTKAGFDWPDVVDSVVYLPRAGDFDKVDEVYRQLFKAFGSRTVVEAPLVARDGLVEIMATAVRR